METEQYMSSKTYRLYVYNPPPSQQQLTIPKLVYELNTKNFLTPGQFTRKLIICLFNFQIHSRK